MNHNQNNDDLIERSLEALDCPPPPQGFEQRIIARATSLPQQQAIPETEEQLLPDAANDSSPRWWLAGMGGIAASLMAFFFAFNLIFTPANSEAIQTALGEQQVITLDDGSVITLNGGSQIKLSNENPRLVELTEGEVIFEIAHNEAKPFVIEVEGIRLVDRGTVFNVKKHASSIAVAVAEGLVEIEASDGTQLLNPGEFAEIRNGQISTTGTVDTSTIGRWTEGVLVYDMDLLSLVAQDLSRASGKQFEIDPALTDYRFSGAIVVDEASPLTAISLSQVLGVSVTEAGTVWQLSPE